MVMVVMMMVAVVVVMFIIVVVMAVMFIMVVVVVAMAMAGRRTATTVIIYISCCMGHRPALCRASAQPLHVFTLSPPAPRSGHSDGLCFVDKNRAAPTMAHSCQRTELGDLQGPPTVCP